jgi:hypothetical protein
VADVTCSVGLPATQVTMRVNTVFPSDWNCTAADGPGPWSEPTAWKPGCGIQLLTETSPSSHRANTVPGAASSDTTPLPVGSTAGAGLAGLLGPSAASALAMSSSESVAGRAPAEVPTATATAAQAATAAAAHSTTLVSVVAMALLFHRSS